MDRFQQAFDQVERPFAWLDFTALDQNIDFVNGACGEKQIRIATKSVRSVALLQYIANRIKKFAGFMTFTAAETAFLLEQGLDNLLMGYPVFEQQALKRIMSFVQQDKQVTFMVDHVDQAQLLANEATKASRTDEATGSRKRRIFYGIGAM